MDIKNGYLNSPWIHQLYREILDEVGDKFHQGLMLGSTQVPGIVELVNMVYWVGEHHEDS